jgi:hypothetical protein
MRSDLSRAARRQPAFVWPVGCHDFLFTAHRNASISVSKAHIKRRYDARISLSYGKAIRSVACSCLMSASGYEKGG